MADGDFPQCWSETTVIPIQKPGKDRSDPNNYDIVVFL